jgi:hypothetical protein
LGLDNKNKLTKTALGHFPAQKAEKGIIMKTFYISVTETLNRIVEVHAEDSSEALQKAEDAYYNGEIELDYNDMVDTDFNDETEETINNYELGGMPKYYEVK